MFLRDLFHHGVLRAVGSDFPDLLHRLSTNDITSMQPGDVRETVIITDKARIIDVVLVLVREDDVLLLTSPGKTDELLEWFAKYTIMEDVHYSDAGDAFGQFEIHSDDLTSVLNANTIPVPPLWKSCREQIATVPAMIIRHDSICAPGIRILARKEDGGTISKTIRSSLLSDALNIDSEEGFDFWRIRHGYPKVGFELTERVHPLESGAERVVNFSKGCYIGQEVIARLDSYNKIQRHLRSLVFCSPVEDISELPCDLFVDGKNAGFLTSFATDTANGITLGLGCIRLAYEMPGTVLSLGTGAGAAELVVSA